MKKSMYDLETGKDLKYESQYNTKEQILKQISRYYKKKGDADNARELIEETFKGSNLSYPGRKISRSGYGIVGRATRSVLIETGKVNFYGQKFKDIQELVTLLQIFKNPKYETFESSVDKSDEIVGIDASGDPRLSPEDIGASANYDKNLRGYAGQIVINSTLL